MNILKHGNTYPILGAELVTFTCRCGCIFEEEKRLCYPVKSRGPQIVTLPSRENGYNEDVYEINVTGVACNCPECGRTATACEETMTYKHSV